MGCIMLWFLPGDHVRMSLAVPSCPACWRRSIPGCAALSGRQLRLRGGLAMRRNANDAEKSDNSGKSEQGKQGSMEGNCASAHSKIARHAKLAGGKSGAEGHLAERKRQRGPRQDPTKRKRRGRRGGKHAKAARERRAAQPIDEEVLGDIKSLAATLAEISAAAPHAVEQAALTDDVDPVMRYIIPSQDGQEDVKRTSLFEDRQRVIASGSKFAQRLHGAAPPVSWVKAWFACGKVARDVGTIWQRLGDFQPCIPPRQRFDGALK